MKRIIIGTDRKIETKYKRYIASLINVIERTRFTDAQYTDFNTYIKNLAISSTIDIGKVKEELNDLAISMISSSYAKLGLDEDITDTLSLWIEQFVDSNVLLIEGLMIDSRKALQTIITDGIMNGKSVSQIKSKLKEKFGYLNYRAETIAITETAKAMSYINRENLKSIGVNDVVWSSANDKRVRKCHLARNKKEYSINKGCYSSCDGNYLHVGMEVRCRCAMVALL